MLSLKSYGICSVYRSARYDPRGNPVTAVPGATPKSPVTTVGPVFVTVEPARTAKLCAVPSEGAVPWPNAWVEFAIRRIVAKKVSAAVYL